MPVLGKKLTGLTAKDRTSEEKKEINVLTGRQSEPEISADSIKIEEPRTFGNKAAINKQVNQYLEDLQQKYTDVLYERQQQYGTDRDTTNGTVNEYLDKISSDVSSYYKKFRGTDKLPLSDQEKKDVASQYDARKETYGEDNANIWLDSYYKNKVAKNQSLFEQGIHAVSHLIPAIEGGLIQTYGMLHGAVNHVIGSEGYGENQDLNWWDSFINDVIDNPVTRYGRDIEMSGGSHISDALKVIGLSDQTANEKIASMKATATKYNPEGIGEDIIATTDEQDQSNFSSATPFQALQAGGFTALSMLTGAAEAKAANWIFNGLARGANALNKAGRIIKTEEGLIKTLEGLKRAQNFTDLTIIPGTVGSVEGALEGLNTKIEVERKAIEDLDNFYKEKVEKEALEAYNDDAINPSIEVMSPDGSTSYQKPYTSDQIFQQTWDKYKDEYAEARRQIDWASSKAGIHNFWANSMINGMLNSTLKAGLMAPRVQETLRNSKMFGWAYRNPRFKIDENYVATPVISKASAVGRLLKEPLGEGMEEYLQSLSNDVFSSAAENNIHEFIENKFNGDGTAEIADSFGSDYAAALTALKGSLTNKESIQSAILGAVSSTMGTVGGIGRGYHRDENGNLVRNGIGIENLKRGLNAQGQQESWGEYMRRVTPWRSGAINAYFDRRKEIADAEETAANITEWLNDPTNRAKWDGLQGTANWMSQMENAAESNDQFSYRKAQMGKAINDILMLKKLEGTDLHETVIADLQRAANGEISQEDIQKLKQNGGDEYLAMSDEEVAEKVQSNANKMLGLMSQVEAESKRLDRILGRIDEDTKQSLIYGKIMKQDFAERRDQLQEEIETIKSRIKSSTQRSGTALTEAQKALILKYGSINKALKSMSSLESEKEKLEKKISEVEAISKEKLTDKQKENLLKDKQSLKRISKQLEDFAGLKQGVKQEEGESLSTIAQLVLNEEEIMNLDPVTRAMVLAQGANKLYNATHQSKQKIDQLNLEIDELNKQIDTLEAQVKGWTNSDGSVKKRHNKQVERNNKTIKDLKQQKDKKMRALDAERGQATSKPVYNSKQQEVIDNLVQQGMAQDSDFLDKIVDMGRLELGIKDYNTQYQAVLSDPKAFQNYVLRAKYNAEKDLVRRRAERISRIEDFKEYSQELDRVMANASDDERNEIFRVLTAEDAKARRASISDDETSSDEQLVTNFSKYMENHNKVGELVKQFSKNDNLTDNDMSLLIAAMQYLQSNGVDVTDRENAVQALLEKDAEGNLGGMFRQWVEDRNSSLPIQQRTFMPVFTSIGQVVNQYVDILNGQQEDAIERGNLKPVIEKAENPQQVATVTPSPNPSSSEENNSETNAGQAAPSLFNVGYSSAEGEQFTDNDGTVATDAQTKSVQNKQQKELSTDELVSGIEYEFSKVAPAEVAKDLNIVGNIIDNSDADAETKELAWQYFLSIAVNGEEKYDSVDEVLTAIQEKIEELRSQSDMQKNTDNKYSRAASLLDKAFTSLHIKTVRSKRRDPRMSTGRPEDTKAGWIHTADIATLESKNPDAWAVRFYDDHAIDEWNREHTISADTPVYFITDSEWSAEVMRQMTPTEEEQKKNPNGRKYDTLTDMPIVVAVRVEEPKNAENTTAIEVDGVWYQPIGVLPSTKARLQGSERTFDIRKLASKEEGRHLVTSNGNANGRPLITRVYGANYLTAHHRDANTQMKRENSAENNNDVTALIIESLPAASRLRLQALSKEELLKDNEYLQARVKFLNAMSWNEDRDQANYTPENHRSGETGNPMLVFTKSMSETAGRTTEKTLQEVLNEGGNDEVVEFNSRTERLYNEVIRPLFQYLPLEDRSGDRSAKIITQQDLAANPNAFTEEAQRLTKLFNGYDGTSNTSGLKGISNFIYIVPTSGWQILVTAPEALQNTTDDITTSQSVYKVFLKNDDPSIAPIEIGTITAGQRDTEAAKEMLRNLMLDSSTGQVRDFLRWQLPKADVQNANNPKEGNARRNIGAIVDDGILEIAGTSLVYEVDGVKLRAPINNEGQPVYTEDKVANSSNAQPSSPQNTTPLAEGSINTREGSTIEPTSGAVLSKPEQMNNASQKSEKLKNAEAATKKIVTDSKDFKLSEDETYYYITDKATGQEVKYLRVTTVIGADESLPELTEEEAKSRKVKEYIWTPSITQILDKLNITNLSKDQLSAIKDTKSMSQVSGVSEEDIKKAVAELRTEHKKEKYGVWGVPSTSVGNTADVITRDFLAGHLKDCYPNIKKDALERFVNQLRLFKSDLESKGIHIVSEGVMAHGKITMMDKSGQTHDVNVAGTLDLFGYDDDGNFYIFDMKTTRDHSATKLQKEKAKWSRQISMYKDLLEQTYGIKIATNNLRIIPINVDYPTPMGKKEDFLSPSGPQYSEDSNGQLKMTFRGGEVVDFEDSNLQMRSSEVNGQFNPGYTPFNINWDNLSSEDQDIVSSLEAQSNGTGNTISSPQSAHIEKKKSSLPSFLAPDMRSDDYESGAQEPAPTPPPITSSGTKPLLPTWRNLTQGQKDFLKNVYGIENAEDYSDILNDPATAEGIVQDMKCKGLM